MADASRRKGGATAARSHQAFLQQQVGAQAGTPTGGARGFGSSTPTNRGYAKPGANARGGGGGGGGQKGQLPAKMGIKSGMTVEELKRLTQKRMQQSGGPATPKSPALGPHAEGFGAAGRPATPKINVAAINASTAAGVATPTGGPGTPVMPKMGMTVQELKQLTTLRLASQSVPTRQTEITGLVSNAVLNNAAKSQYRDSLRGSLTPGSAPKRPGFGSLGLRAGNNNANEVIPVRGNRSRSRSSQLMKTVEPPADTAPTRYSYSGQSLEEYLAFDYSLGDGGNSSSSQETDPYAHPSFDDDEGSKPSFDGSLSRHSLQFPEDSFPPPPPLDETGGFVSTSLPSWSPPPARAKKLDSTPSIPPSFYNQQTSYYNIASKDDAANQDQNAVIAPPPGLSRRPSMTVPWQVAEAVLNTPQTITTRKKLASPTSSSNTASEPESAKFDDGSASSMKSPAAEAAVQLGALTSQIARNRSSSGAPPLAGAPVNQPLNPLNGARRGSFGNAAEFFKFRRRSKSRLELARDFPSNFAGAANGDGDMAFPNYGAAGTMPGIDETVGDVQEGGTRGDTVSDASSSTSDNDDDDGSSSQDYTDEDVVQVTGGYDDMTEISNNFVQFYHASGASGRGRDNLSGLSNLSIPPPPPPPMTDDEDDASTTSSSKGLPMMSPNGLRLRKVAELARRGSLSSEDKTRAKDEIIQSSLGIGATNAARIFSSNMGERAPVPTSSVVPPPGFSAPSPPPPRDMKAGAKKTLVPGAGIARGNMAGGVPGRIPATAATPLVASPHGAARKTLVEPEAIDNNSSSLEERLAAAAQKVANCVSKGDMVNFQKAMDELDWLRNEANKMMRG